MSRILIGLLMISIAVGIWYATGGRLYAIGLAGVGFVSLLAGIAGGGNSGGYNF
jgi:hypothetical protein